MDSKLIGAAVVGLIVAGLALNTVDDIDTRLSRLENGAAISTALTDSFTTIPVEMAFDDTTTVMVDVVVKRVAQPLTPRMVQ